MAIDDDCGTAIDFAQKMVRLRAVPSASFKAELKERLLSRLSEEKAKVRSTEVKRNRFWEVLERLVPRQPVWRAVTTTTLVFILATVGVFWYMGGFSQPPAPPMPVAPKGVPAPVPAPARPPLELTATPTQSAYLPGEPVTVEFLFKNLSSNLITVRPFPPQIQIMLPRPHGLVQSFAAGSGDLELEPGEMVTHTLVWDQQNVSGQQVAPGYYYIDLKDIYIDGTEVGTMRVGKGTIAKVLIQFPQGAMEKSIEVNQPQTAEEVTITLEWVELSAMGAKVYAFTAPPGYGLQEEGGPGLLPSPSMMMHADAQYSVDGGPVKETGPSANRFLENGIQFIWENLDPIPIDAKVLTFTITKLGNWQGPWEFSIPLEP